MFFGPDNRIVDAVALGMIGFAIGGLVVFLAGLTACDLMPKNAVGAVKGSSVCSLTSPLLVKS